MAKTYIQESLKTLVFILNFKWSFLKIIISKSHLEKKSFFEKYKREKLSVKLLDKNQKNVFNEFVEETKFF